MLLGKLKSDLQLSSNTSSDYAANIPSKFIGTFLVLSLLASGDILDAFNGLDFLEQLLQAADVIEHDGKGAGEKTVVAVDADAAQQNAFLADDAGDIVDDTQVIITHNTQGDGILTASLACPTCLNNAVTEACPQLRGVRAVLAMYLNTTAAGDKAEDIVAIHGLTAAGHLKIEALEVLVDNNYVRPPIPLMGKCVILHHKLLCTGGRRAPFGLTMVMALLLGIGFEHGVHI